jgi:ankyrin repeat protein
MQATADPNAGEVVCILDALDECAESGRHQIIDSLNSFYKESSSSEAGSNLKFLVTSRPYIDIERRFADLTRNFPTIWLRGEMESNTISSEIDVVIKSEVANLAKRLQLDKSEQSMLQNELLAKEHRTYLWLKLIVDVIKDEIGITKKKLKSIVNTLPATVDQAYEGILLKAKDQERTRKLLHLIIAATRPLTLSEMNIALNIEDNHRSYEDIDLETDVRFETTIRNLCGLFVSIIDQKVYLIHQTAKEFLIGESQTITGQWKSNFNPAESDLVMTRVCIAYLLFNVFDNDFGALRESGWFFSKTSDALTESHAFFSYAASFWASHFRRSQNRVTKELCLSALRICDAQSSRFLNWFVLFWTNSPVRDTRFPDFTGLITASYFGHDVTVKQLLETESDVEVRDRNGRTPLLYAAQNGHEGVVKLLLEANANIKAKDNSGWTPLLYAVGNGHEKIVKLLFEAKADVEAGEDSWTPLLCAAQEGHEKIVKLLLEAKADVEARDIDGRTPLLCAAQNGHEGIVNLLLEANANIKTKDRYGWPPLLYAARSRHEGIVKLLFEAKADLEAEQDGWTPLLYAAQNGYEGIVELFLQAKPYVEEKNRNGRTPLLCAAQNGHEGIVKLLLKAKADVKAREDWHSRTPLLYAAENGYEGIVKLLLKAKANVEAKDRYGWTPLLHAAQNGHEAIVKPLLEAKADVKVKDWSGWTPLSLATRNGHKRIVKLLYFAT